MERLGAELAAEWGVPAARVARFLPWLDRLGLGSSAVQNLEENGGTLGWMSFDLRSVPEDRRMEAWVQLFGIFGMRLPHREILGAITAAHPRLNAVDLTLLGDGAIRVGLLLSGVERGLLDEIVAWGRVAAPEGEGGELWLAYGPGGLILGSADARPGLNQPPV